MTPIALLHLATGTSPTELERDERVESLRLDFARWYA